MMTYMRFLERLYTRLHLRPWAWMMRKQIGFMERHSMTRHASQVLFPLFIVADLIILVTVHQTKAGK